MLNLFTGNEEGDEEAAVSSIGSSADTSSGEEGSSESEDEESDSDEEESGKEEQDDEESDESDSNSEDEESEADDGDLQQKEEDVVGDEEEGLIGTHSFHDEPTPESEDDLLSTNSEERRRRMSKYEEEVAEVEEMERQRKRRIGLMVCACIVILAIVIGIAVPLSNRNSSQDDKEDGDSAQKPRDVNGSSPSAAPVSPQPQETDPLPIKAGTLQLANGEGGASATVQVEYTTLVQDPSQIQYYLNTDNQDFFEQIWTTATTLYLTADESPTIDSISSTTSRRRQLQSSPSIPVHIPDFPYLLLDGYFPGDYPGMILVEESLTGGPPVVLSSGVFDTILDPSMDIKDPNPPISTTAAPTTTTENIPSDEPSMVPSLSPTGNTAPPLDGAPTNQPSGSVPTNLPSNPPLLPTDPPTIDFASKNVTEDMTLWEQLTSIEDVQTFVESVDVTDLDDVLQDLEDATLFVPMDSAFDRLSQQRPELSQALLSNHPYWNDCLRDVLLYHVYLPDKLNSTDFAMQTQSTYTMASGEDIAVGLFQKTDGEFLVDTFMDESGGIAYAVDARMDNYGRNGIYHIVRHVFLPKWTGKDILETLKHEGFQVLLEGLAMVGLNETLARYGTDSEQLGWTVFAPTDDALEEFLNTLDEEELTLDQIQQLLLHHVLVGPADSSFALAGGNQTAETAADTDLIVSVFSSQKKTENEDESVTIMIDDATVLQADMKASNGIIHAIDRVLIPEGLELPYKSQKNATDADGNSTVSSLLEVATSIEELSIYVDSTGVVPLFQEVLESVSPLTIFPFTNDAYEAFVSEELQFASALTNDAYHRHVQELLGYHVGPQEKLMAEQLTDKDQIVMYNGLDIEIVRDDDKLCLVDETGRSSCVLPQLFDLEAANGVAHALDSILRPLWSTQSLIEVMTESSDGSFSTLLQLLQTTGLSQTLVGFGDMGAGYTLFAPNDSAFDQIFANIDPDSLSIDELTTILLNHVVEGAVSADALSEKNEIVMMGGATFSIRGDIGLPGNGTQRDLGVFTGLSIGGVDIVSIDTLAKNGIVHVVDFVLIPEEFNGGNNSTTIPDDTNPNNSTNSTDATMDTPAEELENRLFEIAAGISSLEVLSVEGSPQASSLRKLMDDALALLLENGVSISDLEALQRYVMGILYYMTGGDVWDPNQALFFGQSDVCNWAAGTGYITCDASGENIVGISVNFLNLVGYLPSELAVLSSLKSLNLRENQLFGTVPTELFSIPALEEIDLASNQLTGTLSADLGSSTSSLLTKLDLFGNDLTGTIPTEISVLTTLVDLTLSRNRFSGTLPSEMGNLSLLQRFGVDGNQCSGTIPTEMLQLTSLEQLFVQENFFTGQIPAELCTDPFDFESLYADCLDSQVAVPPVTCDCCSACYDIMGNWEFCDYDSEESLCVPNAR